MAMVAFVCMLWFIHIGIAFFFSAPIVLLGRRRVQWHVWDLAAAVVPFSLWFVLMLIDGAGKSMSNVALEPVYLALALPFAAVGRVLIGKSMEERLTATCIITVLTAVAAAIHWFVPGLPE